MRTLIARRARGEEGERDLPRSRSLRGIQTPPERVVFGCGFEVASWWFSIVRHWGVFDALMYKKMWWDLRTQVGSAGQRRPISNSLEST